MKPKPAPSTTTKATCHECKQPVYKNARGEILMHTISGNVYSLNPSSGICKGSVPGARP